jgi:peptidoglycan/LPS O-acetylase OafA/YrhL
MVRDVTAVLERKSSALQAGQQSSTPAPVELRTLTSLRGFAAMAVVVCHAAGILLRLPLDGNIAFSHAVSFFFVLSGFILTYVHPSVIGRAQIFKFWRARFARIYPAHIFSLALILCLCPWSHIKDNALQLLANIFLVHDWIPHYTFFQCYNLPSWSVSDELFFYLLFPVLIYKIKQTWAVKLAASVALVMAVISLPAVFKFSTTGLNGLTLFGMYYFFPASRLFEFVLGMSAAVLWTRMRDLKLSVPLATLLEVLAVALFLAFGANTYFILKPFLTNPSVIFQGLGTWLTLTGNAIPFAATILIFAMQRGVISQIIKFRPLVWLGDISYSTYLLHYPIMLQVLQWKHQFHLNNVCTIAVLCAVLIPACSLSYYFIEMPMRRFIVGKRKREKTTPQEVVSMLGETLAQAGSASTPDAASQSATAEASASATV